MTLIATSSDGYASIFTFEEGELGVPAAEQPQRSMGPLEDSLVNGTSTLSPAKPSVASSANSPAQQTIANGPPLATSSKAEDVFALPTTQPAILRKEDSDVIMLTSEPEQVPSAEQQPKKVKKRVALTHVGPLGSAA